MTVFSPAKVNLHLAVKDRRPDGFHNLESVFLAVDFGDTLHFEPISGENTTELAMDTDIPMEENIIYKALSLFRAKTGFKKSLKITVEKRIPIGGGLGGGSSNAASALLALNRLSGAPLSPETLLELGSSLGSDVPFFLRQTSAALVTGRGEGIEPLEPPDFSLVLVNPGFQSNTAAAYRLLDEYRHNSENNSRRGAEAQRTQRKILGFSSVSIILSPPSSPSASSASSASPREYYNDFMPVFPAPEKQAYNAIISRLQELGASFAGLSGAGSTCFGVYTDDAQAKKAVESLQNSWNFVEFCRPYRNFF
jgi:4-diphosphocytidyl-2-C-methyl-D-erythritol kinase